VDRSQAGARPTTKITAADHSPTRGITQWLPPPHSHLVFKMDSPGAVAATSPTAPPSAVITCSIEARATLLLNTNSQAIDESQPKYATRATAIRCGRAAGGASWSTRLVIETRWVSKALAFAGKGGPRRLNQAAESHRRGKDPLQLQLCLAGELSAARVTGTAHHLGHLQATPHPGFTARRRPSAEFSIFIDKNRRHIGKSQSERAAALRRRPEPLGAQRRPGFCSAGWWLRAAQ
jgi:hypothetical protein